MRVLLTSLAAAVVVTGEFAAGGADVPTTVLDALAGASFLAVGVAAAEGSKRYAVLAGLSGVAWFAGGFSELLLWVHRPLMLHCAFAYPTGRLRGRLTRTVVAASWVSALVLPFARDARISLLLAAGIAVAGWRLVAEATVGRRGSARTAARVAGVLAMGLALPSAIRVLSPDATTGTVMINLYASLVSVAGLILLGGFLSQPVGQEMDVVIELTDDDPETTLAALRREADARDDQASRGALIAAIDLLQSNVVVRAELAEKVEEVRGSRRRLVEAAVVERRRLEELLADGAITYLDELADTVRALCERNGEQLRALARRSLEEAEQTRADLAQLAQGLHPRVLVDHGLSVALAELAERSPVPATVRVPKERFSMIVESTVWYACAEAMANLGKYAQARSAAVEVHVAGDDLVACVSDDGVGGAHVLPSGGLAGLTDRLGAVDGDLVVDSPHGAGTRVLIRVSLR